MQALTMRELRQYNLDIAYLSEVRMPGNGPSVINVPGEDTCYHFYNRGRRNVAIALSEAPQAALLAWAPFLSHLASAFLKGAIANFTVITVFAPALNAEKRGGGAKDSFYDGLQGMINSTPSGDMLIVARDWNARPGLADMVTHPGKVCSGLCSPCLLNFASANRSVVSCTRFQ